MNSLLTLTFVHIIDPLFNMEAEPNRTPTRKSEDVKSYLQTRNMVRHWWDNLSEQSVTRHTADPVGFS